MDKVSFFVQRLIGLRNMVVILFICGHIDNLVCNPRIFWICFVDLTVRSFHKTVLVDPGVRCQGVDQTDVRTLRSLDGAHSSVMGVMYISNLETCTVS